MKALKYILIGLVSVLLTLSTLSLFNPYIEFENKVYIDRDAPYVVAAFLDPETMEKWAPISEMRHLSGLPLMEGSKDLMVFEANGEKIEVVTEVVKFTPYETMVLDYSNHDFSGRMSIGFHSESSKRTLLTVHQKVRLNNFLLRGIASLLDPIFADLSGSFFQSFKAAAER